jgi:tetratricopeptide (TPR) repeat protein
VIALPERPARLADRAVAAWVEPVVIPTYPVPSPDRNPLFLEKRVYQGSSGRVYPNPVTDRVTDLAEERTWTAIHLENEWLRVMVLPEIGGRVHVVQDRVTGYDLVYRQNVIKPALVGLLGPWISGGIELNWPQHHRPTTFMPLDWHLEELPDGGAAAWCAEHEPMARMKGMHGIVLRPGSAVLEVAVRLENRTPLVETFLWWANIAVRVHDRYEAFFPPDVTHVADHAKRAMSTFPVARGRYYGVDYGARTEAEADLRWYRNIPVPTSYMAIGTREDSFGGYDHAAEAGFVHWADHAISPGKKLWTWGDHEFGHAWDRELTDSDGPYIELMAGVFTDNQPDFGFLMPGEVRTFSQYLYPIHRIGPAHRASLDAAVSLDVRADRVRVGVAVTRPRSGLRVRLLAGERELLSSLHDLAPGAPLVRDLALDEPVQATHLELIVEDGDGQLVRYRPAHLTEGPPPPPATEPPAPAEVGSLEELNLDGTHLDQYRHATRRPEDYWREALRRDPMDARANTSMGEWHLRRGEAKAAERHLRTALARLTRRNPNPRSGEASYLLGLALRTLGDAAAADDAFGKAGWDGAWQPAADLARAELAAAGGDRERALVLVERSLRGSGGSSVARGLRAALLRRLGQLEAARAIVEATLRDDPLDARAWHERALVDEAGPEPTFPYHAQAALDIAHDEARAGLLEEAQDVLERALTAGPQPGSEPLVRYTLGWLAERRGDGEAAAAHRRLARDLPPDLVFPARPEEVEVLTSASRADPRDARAPYYLGNLLYDRRRYRDAIRAWRRARRLDPAFPTVHRNLGIAEWNVLHRPARALDAFERALRADPDDARLLYELDQLRKRLAQDPAGRLAELERRADLVARRDDLSAELATLLNLVGRHADALRVLEGRRFHPWEGGEGLVSRQWVVAHHELARAALREERPADAVAHLEAAMRYPQGLGEGKHLLTREHETHLLMGLAERQLGSAETARPWFERAASAQGDPAEPQQEARYWRALALRAMGREAEAVAMLEEMRRDARRSQRADARIPYFATSLPTLILFEDDLTRRARLEAAYLEGLALRGLGKAVAARRALAAVAASDPAHQGAVLRIAEIERASRQA